MLNAMLADFAVRLACGLAILLVATPWRIVPPSFFRTHCLVILGLLVLAVLDLSRSGAPSALLAAVIAAALLGYLGAVAWGIGWSRGGVPIAALIALVTGAILVVSSRTADAEVWALNAAGRLSSAFLLGSTLTAMLLGHHYLTAPAMSIDPLKRFVRCMAWGLGVRSVVAALGAWFWLEGRGAIVTPASVCSFFLAIRWGMGVAGPLLATVLAWKTVRIRSTQSATGILYVVVIFCFLGELTGQLLRGSGVTL